MQNTLALTLPIPIKIGLNISLKIFWILALGSIAFLLVFSVIQIGSFAQNKYLLNDYQKRISKLSTENEILEINLSKLNSLANLEQYLQNQSFTKANQTKYIQILESQVVKK